MCIKTLFVEDEPRGVIPYFYDLTQHGFKCCLAKCGDHAVEKLHAHEFELISMDIMFQPGKYLGEHILPIKAGLRLLEMIRSGEIKNCDPSIKVIVLTAVTDYEIETKIKKLGVNAYLRKPVEYSEVIETFCQLKN